MGRLVRLVIGLWTKSAAGVWIFDETPNSQGEAMLLPEGPTTAPITLITDKDVELMSSVIDYMADPLIYVTSGPELVAKYQFFCRTPFSIDDKTYLQEGITEKEHCQAIIDLVGGHPIVCSKHMLEIMFNEPQLLLVFRVALEIEIVYGLENENDDTDEGRQDNHLTGDDIMSLEGAVSLSPDQLNNFNDNSHVLYGEPVTIEELQNTLPNFESAVMVHQAATLGVEPMNLWEDAEDEEAYWDDMIEDGRSYEVYVAASPDPTEEVIGLPLSQNRRVCAPQRPTIFFIDDDSESSYTGSYDSFNNMENRTAVPPPVAQVPDSILPPNNAENGITGECSAEVAVPNNVNNVELHSGRIPSTNAAFPEISLDLTLGIGLGNNRAEPEPSIENQDSSSEADDGSGGFGPLF
ncbi:hypothetical protein IGI04_019085 [Brassica rapa subsp. trilocularis]|uniref:Uncharacterized protein n=1 Tax=Brassica rapa subsp. trilocularis TaxID=1813537 RepID=A0ABQ7MH75_BRACM|nr:hypothetical protein IGI04_019085 [Brassica rapa subsp. trilocularis]